MRQILLGIFLLFAFHNLTAQEQHTIEWQKPIHNESTTMLWYTNANSSFSSTLTPDYCGEFAPNQPTLIELTNIIFAPLTAEEEKIMAFATVPHEIKLDQFLSFEAGQPIIKYCFSPVKINATTGKIEKVVSFNIEENSQPVASFAQKTTTTFDENSPLASGTWYRVAVSQTGVFKITPQFLTECGFSISNLSSANIRVFGNGAGMLPEGNDQIDFAGLKEVAMWVVDGGDGVFNGNDYALFYAVGPHTWHYVEDVNNPSLNRFEHRKNVYDDKSYYFITIDNGSGKRIAPGAPQPTITNYTSSKSDDLQFIEHDLVNLVGSGRRWFGDLFDFKTSFDYTLQFANLAQNDTAWLSIRAVARSISSSTMNFRINNNLTAALNFGAVGNNPGNDHVVERSTRVPFIQNANTLNINVQYQKNGNASATAWLDFISVHARRNLNLSGNSIVFRDCKAFLAGGAARYEITGGTNNPIIWDVTNQNDARLIAFTENNNILQFSAPSDSLRTFVALRGSNFPSPEKIGSVANQNLHALEDIEMVIVAHPNFLGEANRLANFNRMHKNMSVLVVTPQEIYNEFSSGMQDITAIKLLLRNLYEKSSGSKSLKYLLLFGDASYDYKNRLSNMHNFVPIYQGDASYTLNTSFCTDDYYGYLEPHEGYKMLVESIDIGIGRLPVTNATQAKNAVNKIIKYQTEGDHHGDWRNRLLFSADDVDAGWETDFTIYMDKLANQLDTTAPNFNAQKIYLDAYNQVVLAGSQRYPEAQNDLFRKVQNGALITSYLGHGGEVGWAKERLLQLKDINSWTNFKNMTLLITVTCEFTRVDDPSRVSAGEQTFLNPSGGAIALISTTRPIYATTSTYNVNRIVMENLLYDDNGYYKSLGEAVMTSKNANQNGERVRFILIGDPSMHLAIPKYEVYTDSINGQHISVFADTINALSKVRISGYVGKANNGGIMSNFNGLLYPTVFDKKSPRLTLVNDGISHPIPFETQENIIFRGKVSVTNGRFEYEFMVPLDISFAFGQGKISYYATDYQTLDAAGSNRDVMIGGLNLSAPADPIGPMVRVFINDTNFISGGITDQNPIGLALISDSSGINTVGSGIGHDIIGILDGDTENPLILNNYFTSDLDSYTSGSVNYPFYNLASGEHTLMVRAWDVYNNFGQATIKFIVDDSPQIALNRLFNYPNPFQDYTTFQFEHNRAGEPLEVEIHIFNQMGEIVKTFNEQLVSTGNLVNEIEWDGTSNQGYQLGAGVYVYRVRVKSQKDNSEAFGFSRLVFIK